MTEGKFSPVETISTDSGSSPEEGIGLCLSGGGYRAMLFHLGVLWRLNEAGLLPRLSRISSVSGGSIVAALLGLRWSDLAWDAGGAGARFCELVADRILDLAGRTIDVGSIIKGILFPGSVSSRVERAYRKHLFGNATLQDLPDDGAGAPRFVINATNVQSGAIWRFSRPYMADWRVGRADRPTVPLARAVAASSAFPPVLSPARLELAPGIVKDAQGTDLHRPPFTTRVVLTDGGVYDNLGLETVWKRYRTVIVSDGGGQMAPEASPAGDWVRHALRVNALIDNQVRSLRKRMVVGALESGERKGVFWRMRGKFHKYPGRSPKLDCPYERTLPLAETPTRLAAMPRELRERIVNWGYALCDAGMRSFMDPGLTEPAGFPFLKAGV